MVSAQPAASPISLPSAADTTPVRTETIELDPSIATAHSNLAVILDEAGRDREAAVHYRRAIALLGDKNAAYRDRLREALEKLEP